MVYTTKYMKNQPKAAQKRVQKFKDGGAVMRSESTEAARATKDKWDASDDYNKAKLKEFQMDEKPGAFSGRRLARKDTALMRDRLEKATKREVEVGEQTAHPYAGSPSSVGKEDMKNFRRDYGTDDE